MENEVVKKIKTAYITNEIKIYSKGILVALAVSMVSILLFAVFLKFVDINTTWILNINQMIKIISILIACCIIKNKTKMSWLKGLFIGFIYGVLTFLIFSLLAGSFVFDLSLLYNILFSTLIGLICGIIARV